MAYMLYLLLGENHIAKKEFIHHLARAQKAELEYVRGGNAAPEWGQLTEASLFGGVKVLAIEGLLASLDMEKVLPIFKKSTHHILLVEDKLDLRKNEHKKLFKDADISVHTFDIPEGHELASWIRSRVTAQGGAISAAAIAQLLEMLLPTAENSFTTPVVNMWQLDYELAKLCTYASGQEITPEIVSALVPKNYDTQGWSIINALADRKRDELFLLLENYFHQGDGADHKTKIILLNALLADQLRSILMVKSFVSNQMSDSDMLAQTSWKSGRLYAVKKTASKFDASKLISILEKLEHLDIELKTGSVPPRVLLDVILAQII